MAKFQTNEEVEEYLNAPLIKCLLCEKYYKSLPTHIQSKHDTSAETYHEMFGIPWHRGLCCPDTIKKMSSSLKKRIITGTIKPPPFKLLLEIARASPQRKPQPATNDKRKKAVLSSVEKRINNSRKHSINEVLYSGGEIAKMAGLSDTTIYSRLRNGITGNALIEGSKQGGAEIIEINDKLYTRKEIAEIAGVSVFAIASRLKKGTKGEALFKGKYKK